MEVKPIKTEADYENALDRISALLDAAAGSPEADLLEVLATLIEVYENEHYPIAPPDPIEFIKYRMEQEGLSRRDLEPYIGSRARVSEILNRKRPLTLQMIQRLHKGLGVPAEVLIAPTERETLPKPA